MENKINLTFDGLMFETFDNFLNYLSWLDFKQKIRPSELQYLIEGYCKKYDESLEESVLYVDYKTLKYMMNEQEEIFKKIKTNK